MEYTFEFVFSLTGLKYISILTCLLFLLSLTSLIFVIPALFTKDWTFVRFIEWILPLGIAIFEFVVKINENNPDFGQTVGMVFVLIITFVIYGVVIYTPTILLSLQDVTLLGLFLTYLGTFVALFILAYLFNIFSCLIGIVFGSVLAFVIFICILKLLGVFAESFSRYYEF